MTTIDSNIAPPSDEPPKKKTRARRSAAAATPKDKKPNPASELLKALKFISVAQRKVGAPHMQFSFIQNHWAAAFDGIIMAAHPIPEDLFACPHTLQLRDALSKVGEDLSITQLSAETLAVTSGAFRALIPCCSPDEIGMAGPDPQCAVVDDRLRAAIRAVAGLATEDAPQAHLAAVLVQAGSVAATNGHALIEAWHGIDLPPGLLVPKRAAVAITLAPYELTGFGFSQSSATFYFENGSFIKTQLYGEKFPNYSQLLNAQGLNPWALPDEFFKGIKAVESFSPNGQIYFKEGIILSQKYQNEATTYKIEGLPDGMGFSAKLLLAVEHAMQKVHFDAENTRAFFFANDNSIRGCVMGLDMGTETVQESQGPNFDDLDDDIPF